MTAETIEAGFGVGDVVALTSGGQAMTVIGWEIDAAGDQEAVQVAWTDDDGVPHEAVYPAAALMLAEIEDGDDGDC